MESIHIGFVESVQKIFSESNFSSKFRKKMVYSNHIFQAMNDAFP